MFETVIAVAGVGAGLSFIAGAAFGRYSKKQEMKLAWAAEQPFRLDGRSFYLVEHAEMHQLRVCEERCRRYDVSRSAP